MTFFFAFESFMTRKQDRNVTLTINKRMQSFSELACAECGKNYTSASLMLQHFAEHVFETSHEKTQTKKASIPGLYPINLRKKKSQSEDDSQEGRDVDIDESPVEYCEIALIEGANNTSLYENGGENEITTLENKSSSLMKKYKCMYCTKSFGWSTDLKRHILVHTGERPFKCDHCLMGFTRNFLLQKHLHRMHNKNANNSDKIDIPDLEPISNVKRIKPRKQDKCKIKKNPGSLISL